MSDKDVKRIYDGLWAHDSIAINDVLNESPNACTREQLLREVFTEQPKYSSTDRADLEVTAPVLWDRNGSEYSLDLSTSTDAQNNRTDTLLRTKIQYPNSAPEKIVSIIVGNKACDP